MTVTKAELEQINRELQASNLPAVEAREQTLAGQEPADAPEAFRVRQIFTEVQQTVSELERLHKDAQRMAERESQQPAATTTAKFRKPEGAMSLNVEARCGFPHERYRRSQSTGSEWQRSRPCGFALSPRFQGWQHFLLRAAVCLHVRDSVHYGSAGFAAPREIADLLLPQKSVLPKGSILLGKLVGSMSSSQQVALPLPFTGQHGVIVGGSGSGKSFSFFLPNVAATSNLSCVVTDPKSELWRYTSGFYPCATRFAPGDPDASACLNWIPLCRDARIAELCARAVVEAGATERQEPPWPDLEAAFLSALFAHAATLLIPTPLTAYQLFTRLEPQKLLDAFLGSQSSVAREQAIIFQQTNERMRGSIVPVIASKLQCLRDPSVARFTSASLAPPDFGRLRLAPEAIYWCVREQDMVRLRPLSSIFFSASPGTTRRRKRGRNTKRERQQHSTSGEYLPR